MKDKLLIILYILIPIAIITLIIYFIEINKPLEELTLEINSPDESETIDKKELEKDNMRVKAIINDKEYVIVLEKNETAIDFTKLLPLDIDMSELNGNEKYYYLDKNITSNPINVNRIMTGDIMLYGDNCLVLFYKGFNTKYSYTRIGHIEDVKGLVSSVGKGKINVKFEIISD